LTFVRLLGPADSFVRFLSLAGFDLEGFSSSPSSVAFSFFCLFFSRNSLTRFFLFCKSWMKSRCALCFCFLSKNLGSNLSPSRTRSDGIKAKIYKVKHGIRRHASLLPNFTRLYTIPFLYNPLSQLQDYPSG
jgi:hypothetical protein